METYTPLCAGGCNNQDANAAEWIVLRRGEREGGPLSCSHSVVSCVTWRMVLSVCGQSQPHMHTVPHPSVQTTVPEPLNTSGCPPSTPTPAVFYNTLTQTTFFLLLPKGKSPQAFSPPPNNQPINFTVSWSLYSSGFLCFVLISQIGHFDRTFWFIQRRKQRLKIIIKYA